MTSITFYEADHYEISPCDIEVSVDQNYVGSFDVNSSVELESVDIDITYICDRVMNQGDAMIREFADNLGLSVGAGHSTGLGGELLGKFAADSGDDADDTPDARAGRAMDRLRRLESLEANLKAVMELLK